MVEEVRDEFQNRMHRIQVREFSTAYYVDWSSPLTVLSTTVCLIFLQNPESCTNAKKLVCDIAREGKKKYFRFILFNHGTLILWIVTEDMEFSRLNNSIVSFPACGFGCQLHYGITCVAASFALNRTMILRLGKNLWKVVKVRESFDEKQPLHDQSVFILFSLNTLNVLDIVIKH